jgi:hypothetical protein
MEYRQITKLFDSLMRDYPNMHFYFGKFQRKILTSLDFMSFLESITNAREGIMKRLT